MKRRLTSSLFLILTAVMASATTAPSDGHLALLSAMEDHPDFVAAVYPVVTMRKPYAHKRSRRGLLGEYRKYNKTLQDSLSLERRAARKPHLYLQYEEGGHGFGISKYNWLEQFLKWLCKI